MKAASAVLVQSQLPMTILGLPLPLLVVTCGTAAVAAAAMAVLDLVAAILPAAGIGFAVLWTVFLRRTRQHPFFDRDLFLAGRFWAGRGRRRHLLAGGRL